MWFVREKDQNGQIMVNFLPATEQVDDILTKSLTDKAFCHFQNKFGVMSFMDVLSIFVNLES